MVLLAAFLGWMFDGLEMGIFPLVASSALKEMLADPKEIGPWIGHFHEVFLLGAALGGLVFGWLGDKVGRVRAMTFSVLTYSVFTGVGYWASTPTQLAGLRFLAALGMGGEWSLGVALVMECWPEKLRPMLAGAIGAASNVGFALIAAVAIKFDVTPQSWRWVLLAGLAPALLTFFIRLFVPESEKWKESVKKSDANPLKEIFSPPLLKNTLLCIGFASVALIGTWGSVQWIPSWVDMQLQHGEPKAKAVVQCASAIGAVIGCLIAPIIGNMLGRRMTYFLLCLSSLIVCGILFGTFSEYNMMFVLMAGLVGCVTAAFYGWLPLYLPEIFPTRMRATGQGVSFNSGRILAAVGAACAGSLVKHYDGSFAKSGATITLIYVVGMILIWFAPETKGKPLPE